MKDRLKKIIPYIIITIISAGILLITFKINNFYPFGQYDLAKYDAYFQYKPFLYNFIISIKNGTISSFNFFNGLGNPTIFNYLYYLASPINLVAIPFNSPDAMYFFVIFIKTILTLIITLFYFKKRTDNNYISILCSIAYTFSSWFLSYHIHIMWLDAFMVFPLVQYGLEELMNKNKYNIYIFSLAYTMFTNFYMAFMVCLYIFIYYMYNIIIKKDKYINKIKNFQLIMATTIITCLLASFTIYGTYSSFLKMGINIADNSDFIAPLKVIDLIKSLFIGGSSPNSDHFVKNMPNIGLNIIFIISFLYYFINDKIKLREKITTIIATAIILFVLFSNKMNFFINCFHTPAGYSFRYSFIISFYILIIFIRNYKTFNNKIDFKAFFIIFILFILIILEYVLKIINFYSLIINIVFLLSYTIFLAFYNKNKFHRIIFVALVIFEVIANFSITLIESERYDLELIDYQTISNNEFREKINNDSSYIDVINKNLYSNSSTIETFSSMQYNSVMKLLDNLGCATDMKATIYSCSNTSLFDMIFNVYSTYNLPKVFSVKKDLFLYNIETDNALENQNNLILGMSGLKDIINSQPMNRIEENLYKYVVSNNQEYIIQITPQMKYVRINDNVYINNLNNLPKDYYNLNINIDLFRKKIISKKLKPGDEIEIALIEKSEENKLEISYIDLEKEKTLYNYLSEGAIKYETYKDNYIKGTIKVSDNELIFTSIPYDDNWEVEVDGVKVEAIKLYNSLIGIECDKGEHEIVLKYKNKFNVAIFLSIITLIGLIINIIYRKQKEKAKPNNWYKKIKCLI